MSDDWETFSASPHQQQQPMGKFPIDTLFEQLLSMDCAPWVFILSLLMAGKKAVWFDLDAAEEMGMTGHNIQNTLEAKGIHVYAFALNPMAETIAAIIVVDAENEARAREALAKMGVLLL
jgi:hypothetical protein